jgi:putative GTP pyrophosphokinase
VSRSQIDRLGDRLRGESILQEDLVELDAYRLSFGAAYDTVIGTLRRELDLAPSGRPAKSTSAIRDKLRRESIRLSQMQDIAGCRVICISYRVQDLVVENIASCFANCTIVDRRLRPSHGYRAVHVIVQVNDCPVEIQIRTPIQHLWAEVSEKLADGDSSIKYGGGSTELAQMLLEVSSLGANVEDESYFVKAEQLLVALKRSGKRPSVFRFKDWMLYCKLKLDIVIARLHSRQAVASYKQLLEKIAALKT